MRIMIGSESFHPSISGVAVATRTLDAFLVGQGHQVFVLAPSIDVRNYEETYPEGFQVCRLRKSRQSRLANPLTNEDQGQITHETKPEYGDAPIPFIPPANTRKGLRGS